MKERRDIRGFTLVEMMIVVALLGIIAAIAIPAYTGYVRNARRAEAKSNLQALSLLLEQYYSENGQYCRNGDNCSSVADYTYTVDDSGTVTAQTIVTNYLLSFRPKIGSSSNVLLYNYSINPSSTTAFVITAAPVTSRGAPAGSLTIDQSGTKTGW